MPIPVDPDGPSRILVRLDPARLWRWQAWLVDALTRRPGGRVGVVFAGPGRPLAPAVRWLLQLERLVYRLQGESAADLLDFRDLPDRPLDGPPDLVIDLSGQDSPSGSVRAVRPHYDGALSEDALIAALLAGRLPIIRLEGAPLHEVRPAVEDPGVLARGLATSFAALLRALLRAASEPRLATFRRDVAVHQTAGAGPGAAGAFAARALAAKAAGRIDALCRAAPRWRVDWRRSPEAGFLRPPGPPHRRLADDGRRYYADPFLYGEGGTVHLFVEEFPFETRRGIISATTIGADGQVAPPRPVLEGEGHLSYPFVFAHAGEVWMIPESSDRRRVDLYRATRFPDRWERAATLLEGVDAADATLIRRDGTWWLFAATRDWGGSSWDALSLFSAPDLLGPWSPHPGNPVVLDVRSARPGGRFFERDGRLWRPAQDGSAGYGSALTLCAVDRLDQDGFVQTVVETLRPGDIGGGRGLHTANWAGGVEAIDRLA